MSDDKSGRPATGLVKWLWVFPLAFAFMFQQQRESAQFAAGWMTGSLLIAAAGAATLAIPYCLWKRAWPRWWSFLNLTVIVFIALQVGSHVIRVAVESLIAKTPNVELARSCAVEAYKRVGNGPDFNRLKEKCYSTHVYAPKRELWRTIDIGAPAYRVNELVGCPSVWVEPQPILRFQDQKIGRWSEYGDCDALNTQGVAWRDMVLKSRASVETDGAVRRAIRCPEQVGMCFHYRWSLATEGYVDAWFDRSGTLVARELFRR